VSDELAALVQYRMSLEMAGEWEREVMIGQGDEIPWQE